MKCLSGFYIALPHGSGFPFGKWFLPTILDKINLGIFKKKWKQFTIITHVCLQGTVILQKQVFTPKTAHMATLLQDDLPPFPAVFRACLSPVLSLSAIQFFHFLSPLCIYNDYDKTWLNSGFQVDVVSWSSNL